MKVTLLSIALLFMSSHSVAANWQYASGTDEMRKIAWREAYTDSPDRLNFGFPYNSDSNTASLHIQVRPGKRQIFLRVDKGQYDCPYDGCRVFLKFDDGPVRTVTGDMPAGGVTHVLLLPYSTIIGQLRKSKRLIIEARFYKEGARQLHFSIEGLEWKD